jgi:Ca2+:H+ antiporter
MPPSTEQTPLLENGNGNSSGRPLSQLVLDFVKADGQPTWAASYKYFALGSWLNVLLIFVPLSFLSHHLNWDAALRFGFSFIAIVPLAKV